MEIIFLSQYIKLWSAFYFITVMEPSSISRLRLYLQKRRVRPRFEFTQGSNGLWICQVTCGPYNGIGGSRVKLQAKLDAARVLVQNMRNIRDAYLTCEEEETALKSRENRAKMVRLLQMLGRRIQDCQNEWTDGHSILFLEELATFLYSQRVTLEERITRSKTGIAAFWILNTSPKIVRASRGPLRSVLRYQLMLRIIDSYLEYLEKKEKQQ